MAEVTLDVEVRTETGKGAGRRLRREGKIPAVVYGKAIQNVDLQVDAAALNRLLQSGASSGLVRLKYAEGSQVALVKDVQTDPVRGEPLHVDFHAVALDEHVQVTVPVVLTGDDARVQDGGVVSQNVWELSIACLPTQIPESIEVDISGLAAGDTLTAGQVALPEGVELRTDAEEAIVSVVVPRGVQEDDEAADAGEEAEEASESAQSEESEGDDN